MPILLALPSRPMIVGILMVSIDFVWNCVRKNLKRYIGINFEFWKKKFQIIKFEIFVIVIVYILQSSRENVANCDFYAIAKSNLVSNQDKTSNDNIAGNGLT